MAGFGNITHAGRQRQGRTEFYPSCRIKFYRRIATQTSSQPESRRPDALPYFLALMFLLLFNTLKHTFRYPSSLLYSLWAFYFCLLACGFKIFPSSSLPRLMLFLLLLFITEKWFVRYARFVSVFEAEHYFFSVAS